MRQAEVEERVGQRDDLGMANGPDFVYTSRFVRAILAQGPC